MCNHTYEKWKVEGTYEAYNQLRRDLTNIARQLAGSGAPDLLVEEAVDHALDKLGMFEAESQFETWVRAVLRNHIVQEQRKQQRRGAASEQLKQPVQVEPEGEQCVEVRELLEECSPQERVLLQAMLDLGEVQVSKAVYERAGMTRNKAGELWRELRARHRTGS